MTQPTLPPSNQPWVNKDGSPSQVFFQFMTQTFENNGADILVRSLRLKATTFANRVQGAPEGTLAAFTDSSTATAGAIISGNGKNHVLGYFDGTNWRVGGA